MINNLKEISVQAGKKIMTYYEQSSIEITTKKDQSPVTIADLEANKIITQQLKKLSQFPIISEEQINTDLNEYKDYWLVDPLDGTKEFINGSPEFTVNIALIKDYKPIIGVIYVPAKQEIFYAEKNKGTFEGDKKIFNSNKSSSIAAISRSHKNSKTNKVLESMNIKETVTIGSSLKFCYLARGDFDIYLRLNPTMHWDTAAGQIIAEEAGCEVFNFETQKILNYKETRRVNPAFIAKRKNF